jgi:hypothetical protein
VRVAAFASSRTRWPPRGHCTVCPEVPLVHAPELAVRHRVGLGAELGEGLATPRCSQYVITTGRRPHSPEEPVLDNSAINEVRDGAGRPAAAKNGALAQRHHLWLFFRCEVGMNDRMGTLLALPIRAASAWMPPSDHQSVHRVCWRCLRTHLH